MNIKTDTAKLSIVSYRHRKRICVKDNEVVLKLTKRVLQGSTNRQSTRFLCICSLHRSLWNSGHSDYSEIPNILPRHVKGENFARGTKKNKILDDFLNKEMENMDGHDCSKLRKLIDEEIWTCSSHPRAHFNFYQFQFNFSLLCLFNSVCTDLFTSLRRFSPPE